MSANLCSLRSELKGLSVECRKSCVLVSKPFIRVGHPSKDERLKVSKQDARRMAVSCQLMPGRLEESFVGRKQIKEPNRKLEFVRTLLIDNYDSYTYNVYQELSVVNGVPPVVVRNDEWTWDDVRHYVLEEKAFDNIVISPGPGSPTCPSDIGICGRLLLECTDIPILGVCLGHQALGYVHGAQVVHANEPVHGRLSDIEHNGCKLFQNIPSGRNSGFKVVRYHSLIIDAETLPKELLPIAWTSSTSTRSFSETDKSFANSNALDNHIRHETSPTFLEANYSNVGSSINHIKLQKQVIMGVMHSTRPHYGLQFHPESVATCFGRQIFKNFREITEDYWLGLRSSLAEKKNINYSACMQVPHSNRQSRASGGNKLVNGAYGQLLSESHKNWHRVNVNKKNHLSMFNQVNFSLLNINMKFLKLRWKKLDQLAARVGGSRVIFSELYGDSKAENTFWLDSSSTEKDRARFSFMGGKGGSLWKHMTFRLSDQRYEKLKHGGYLCIENAQGLTTTTYLEEGFFDFLNKELLSFRYEEKDFEGLPFDFYGGYVGYIGYNLKVECGAASNRHNSRTPDACFFFVDNLVVIDHWSDDVYMLSLQEENTTTTTWLHDTEKKLKNLRASASENLRKTSQVATSPQSKTAFLAEKSQEQYMEDVEKCLRYIKDGESYELCLTTQTRKKIGKLNPIDLYFHLREKNPAPYAAWLNFPKEKLSICSSSPERFLRLDKDGMLEAKPIKGTIARGSTKEEDERLKMKLQYSEKDQAENLMIVDLLRNDLGRVCEPGSVEVPRLMDIETYATVHTMVSTICGKKKPKVSAVDCVTAAFPGGSMTGAPKLRSMELLDSIESCSRGIYSGSIGFFSYNQTFDLNIVIRTIVIHGDEASIGAGGAIVALSNPAEEYEEMILKTRAPVKAIMEFH